MTATAIIQCTNCGNVILRINEDRQLVTSTKCRDCETTLAEAKQNPQVVRDMTRDLIHLLEKESQAGE